MGDGVEFPLSDVEKISITRASQLIRDAGWPDKAKRLDDFLQQGRIKTTTMGLSVLVAGQANKEKIALPTTGLAPPPLNKPGDPATPLERNDTGLLELAGVLLHEADHTLCHGEIEAYGEMIPFGEAVRKKLDELYKTATAEQKAALKRRAEQIIEHGETGRAREVAKEPPDPPKTPDAPKPPAPPPKKPKIKIEISKMVIPGLGEFRTIDAEDPDESYPKEPSSRVEQQMDEIATALVRYREARGSYPAGGNAEMVRALREHDPCAVRPRDLDEASRVLDPWGRPYVYRVPGRVYREHFDLYSTGPCGEDQGGGGDNVICALLRL